MHLYLVQVAKIGDHWRSAFAEAHKSSLDSFFAEAETVFQKDKEEACQKLQQENAQLRLTIEAECSRKLEAAKAENETAIAELRNQHAAEAKTWEAALARHDSDSKLFKYTVRGSLGPHLSGSVPRSIFEAEPDSALARMYNGEWDYAKDEEGQAVVNSDPDNWPIILNWLSFGTVPSVPTDCLLSECRYSQLDKLLAACRSAIESAKPAESQALEVKPATIDTNAGFKVSGMIPQFLKRLLAADGKSTHISLPFTAAGRDWSLSFQQKRKFCLCMHTGPPLTKKYCSMQLGSGAHAISRASSSEQLCESGKPLSWTFTEHEGEQMMHPSMLRIQGAMDVTCTVIFKL